WQFRAPATVPAARGANRRQSSGRGKRRFRTVGIAPQLNSLEGVLSRVDHLDGNAVPARVPALLSVGQLAARRLHLDQVRAALDADEKVGQPVVANSRARLYVRDRAPELASCGAALASVGVLFHGCHLS